MSCLKLAQREVSSFDADVSPIITGLSEAALSSRLADLSTKTDSASSKQLLEAGGFMSRSSRVGWGLNNTFHRSAFQSADEAGRANGLMALIHLEMSHSNTTLSCEALENAF